MRWLLVGCCGLALINITVALQLTQVPRFYGKITGHSVSIYCLSGKILPSKANWYRAAEYGATPAVVKAGERIQIRKSRSTEGGILYIRDLHIDDKGLYFCVVNDTWGPGTKLQVVRPFNRTQAQYRTNMKDGLIILQGLLLAVCIAAILLRRRKLLENSDSLYEEPETDHIYEGLAIETCGGDLYEELSVYAQAEGAEAPWE